MPNEPGNSYGIRRGAMVALLVGLVLVLLLPAGLIGLSAGSTTGALPAPHFVRAAAAPPHHPAPPGAPAPTAQAPQFFQNSSANSANFNGLSYAPCAAYPLTYYSSCEPYTSQPSLLPLTNGTLGLVYAVGTTIVNPVCGNLTVGTGGSRLAFTTSTDNGTSWSSGALFGQTNATCPYYQQLEPSFTTNSSGGIVGAFVGANVSFVNMSVYPQLTGFKTPGLYSNYTNRSNDALLFISSANDGTNWTNGTVLASAGHNIADPKIATFGNTIYIVYEDIANNTTQTLPGYWSYSTSPNYPISVWMIESTNGGATWNAPIELPGENSSQYYNAMSPSIAVSSTGTVAVAYLTNRSCIAYCSSSSNFLPAYGDDLVLVTSTNNGSSWTPIQTIFHQTGEAAALGYSTLYAAYFGPYYGAPLYNLFQYAPFPVLAWNTTGSQLYVAWSGSYNESTPMTSLYNTNYDWQYPTVYAGSAAGPLAAWTVSRLFTDGAYNTIYPNDSYPSFALDPGLTVLNGKVYVSYLVQNLTQTYGGGTGATCGYTASGASFAETSQEWLASSPNGVQFDNRSMLDLQGSMFAGLANWVGTTGSVLVHNGTPLAAFSFPEPFTCFYYCYFGNDMRVAYPYSGPTTNATFQVQAPLPAGVLQYFGIDGQVYSMNDSGLTVTGLPQSLTFFVNVTPVSNVTGFVIEAAGGGAYALTGPRNITLGAQLYTTVNITSAPLIDYFEWYTSGANPYNLNEYDEVYTYFYQRWYSYNFGTCANIRGTAALIPAFVNVTIGFYNYTSTISYIGGGGESFPPGQIVGGGPGSYSGSNANFTVNASGPISEAIYFYPFGEYPVSVAAPTLPNGTAFQFAWDGTPYSSPTGSAVTIANVSTGSYLVTNVSANSSTAGWAYYGTSVPANPIFVPQTVNVQLSFAYENVGTSTGTVSFFAPSLTAGTVWQLSFNNTVYSSSTPWINVTTHSGTYPIQGYLVNGANGSAAYTPAAGLGPTISVLTGHTYDVNYTPAFQVTAMASQGGSVTLPGAHWVSQGAGLSFTATPQSGYVWLGWTGVGAGSYTGTSLQANVTADGPILETANFGPLPANHYSLTIDEVGIPNGTAWSIELDGKGYSSSTSQIVIGNLYGCGAPPAESTYHLYVPDAYTGDQTNLTRYVPGSYTASFCVGARPVSLTFSEEFYLTITSATGGSAAAAVGAGGFGGSAWVAALATVNLRETPSSGYAFNDWVGTGPNSYSGTNSLPTFSMTNAVTESATFTPLPPPPPPARYTETFTLAAPFATGTVWSVSLGSGLTFVSNGNEVNATGLLANTYSVVVATVYAPDHLTQYTPTTASFSLPVHQNGTRQLAFQIAYYVSITSTGPGVVSAAPSGTGFHAAGSTITIAAVPDLDAKFLGYTGTGPGASSAATFNATVTVNGPITEVAAFAAGSGPGPQTTSASSPWSSLTAEAGLAVLGLVIGIVVGLVIVRMRKPPTEGSSVPESVAPSAGENPPPPPGANP